MLGLLLVVLMREQQDRSIPLTSIIATTSQENLRQFHDIFSNNEEEQYQRKFAGSTANASNVFVVKASDATSAVSIGSRVFFGYLPTEQAATTKEKKEQSDYWLVAYLGAGTSSPTSFVIDEVTVEGNVVRLTYSRPKAERVTCDVLQYYFWVPLGELRPGKYRLDLFDVTARAVTLSRYVELGARQ
jgi:hypothetical protein